MTLGELLFSLPVEKRKLFRKLENIDKKIINNKWSNLFNKICLKNNMLPKYVNFKNQVPAVSHTEETINYKWYLIKRDIDEKEKLMHRLNNEKTSAIQEIEATLLPSTTKDEILNELGNLLENYNNISRTRILKN